LNSLDIKFYTPLHIAIINKNETIIEQLIKKDGINLNILYPNGETHLHELINKDLWKYVETFILKGMNVDVLNKKGIAPLHLAVSQNIILLVDILLSKCKANPDILNSALDSPLHIATSNGYFEIIKMLIEKGANINSKNNDGDTPLHIAAINQLEDKMILYLLEKGSDTQIWNKNNFVAEMLYKGDSNIFDKL